MPSVWQDRDLWVDLFRKGIQERHSADLSLYSLYQQFIISLRQSQVEDRICPSTESLRHVEPRSNRRHFRVRRGGKNAI